jgi:hypothetical protein
MGHALAFDDQGDGHDDEPRPRIWHREPVLTLALVQAAIGLGTAFGLDLSAEQVGAVMAFTAALLGWVARERVTPMAGPVPRR